jgi:tetratricopeptide (TPR) repeat protein
VGDLVVARSRFEESLKIARQLAAANPSSEVAQRDLSINLEGLGDLLFEIGDSAGAHARFEESFKIKERLAKANLESTQAQLDLLVSHVRLGSLPGGKPHLNEALKIAFSLQSQGRLDPSNAWMIDDLRERIAAAEKAMP